MVQATIISRPSIECVNEFYCIQRILYLQIYQNLRGKVKPTFMKNLSYILIIPNCNNCKRTKSPTLPTTIKPKVNLRIFRRAKKMSHGIYRPIVVDGSLITDEMKILGGGLPPPTPPPLGTSLGFGLGSLFSPRNAYFNNLLANVNINKLSLIGLC